MKVFVFFVEIFINYSGAVFLAVVVVAVLSYRYFAGPPEGPTGSNRNETRTTATRGRPVTPSMVEVLPVYVKPY